MDFLTFQQWAVKHGYSDSLSIHRLDNAGGYEPGNCMFATREIQNRTRGLDRRNQSGVPGIGQLRGKWRARLTVHGHRYYIGVYSTIGQAIQAQGRARLALFGKKFIKRGGRWLAL